MRAGIGFGICGLVLLGVGFGIQYAAHLPSGLPPFWMPAALLFFYGAFLIVAAALNRKY